MQSPATGSPPTSLLLIDDNAERRNWAIALFSAEYDVACVETRAGLQRRLNDTHVDVILLAGAMTGEDSFEILEALKADPRTQTIPVLLLSDCSENATIQRALSAGAGDVLVSPFQDALVLSRVRLHVDLNRSREELGSAREIQEQLLRMATHDLKIPLTNVRMAENMIWRFIEPGPESAQAMESMSLALDSMQQVVEDFLDAFSVRHNLRVNIEPVALDRVLLDVMLQHSVAAARKGIQLSVDESGLDVLADNQRLTQIINNLVSNAVKYSPYNTTTRLWTRVFPDGVVRICVQDHGPGVPVEERHLLYTEFGQLSARPTGQEGSTGLGLWIVKRLAEAMDGKVGVEFPRQGGSCFWIELPLVPRPVAALTG